MADSKTVSKKTSKKMQNKPEIPLISVVVRTQNRPHLLTKALQSLANQSYAAVEAVVVNDGGQDISNITAAFAKKISGGVQLIQKESIEGRSNAANTGIFAAKGEWLAFLDDDDTFEPDGLTTLAQYIDWDKDVIYGQVQMLQMSTDASNNTKLGLFGESFNADSLLISNNTPICAYICRIKQARKLTGFDADFDYLEDWDFFYRLTRQASVQYVPKIVSTYCVWGESYGVAQRFDGREIQYRQQFYDKHFASLTPEILQKASLGFIYHSQDKLKQQSDAWQAEMATQNATTQTQFTDLKQAQLDNKAQHKQLTATATKLSIQEKKVESLKVERAKLKQKLEASEEQVANWYHQTEHHKAFVTHSTACWAERMNTVLERTSLNLAFELPDQIINLNAYGLTIPLKIFSGETTSIYDAVPIYADLDFPIPLTEGKILEWTFNWGESIAGNALMIRLGTYQRINQCHLHLEMYSLENSEAEPLRAAIRGEDVKDNHYAAFSLDKPVHTGHYRCRLYSPDANNEKHLLAVWLTTNHRRLGGHHVTAYQYIEPDRTVLEQQLSTLSQQPLISIILPTYNTPAQYLRECLDSVLNQVYPNWELCIADDASTEPQVREILDEYQAREPDRIKITYCETNGHISASSNAAIALATGEFISLLDHDDLLTPDALLEIATVLNQSNHAEIDLIYSDEDKWDETHHCFDEPHFKPDWAPENLLGQMYICHFSAYRADLIREIGGFRIGVEGCQDWDLALRFTKKAGRIEHINKVLYHWRKHLGSTSANMESKTYIIEATKKVLNDEMERQAEGGEVRQDGLHHAWVAHYPVPDKEKPKVSIIVPSKDQAELLEPCLDSITQENAYPDWEIILVDNGSKEQATFELYEKIQKRLGKRFKILEKPGPFNFSYMVNQGVKVASGEMILLLNNDTELINPTNWLEEMVGYARRQDIAAVGCKLLYSDETIQHAGVVCGIGGVANHSHVNRHLHDPGYFARLTFVANCSAVTGACLMVKRSLWEQLEGFDEKNLAVAFNDVDFCLRLLELGKRNVLLPQVLFYHHESKSRGSDNTPIKQKRFSGEIAYMKKRWANIIEHDPYYSPHLNRQTADFGIGEHSPYYCEADAEILP